MAVPTLGLLLPVDADRFIRVERRMPAPCGPLVSATFQEQLRQCLDDRLAFRFAMLATLSRFTHALGTSVKPSLGVLGRKGWLFLGDYYDFGFSKYRGLPSVEALPLRDTEPIAAIAARARERDVPFLVVVAPDKPRVYADRLPRWAEEGPAPSRAQPFAAALAARGVDVVYLRQALRAARAAHAPAPVYYETDSHWNMAGAFAGYAATVRALAGRRPSLRGLAPDDIRFERTDYRGDIARFLPLPLPATELRPIARDGRWRPVTVRTDTGREEVDPIAPIETPSQPSISETPDALNRDTLLFLRDSFGDAMAPFMHQTFARTVHLHWATVLGAQPIDFDGLLRDTSPDAIVLMMVERAI